MWNLHNNLVIFKKNFPEKKVRSSEIRSLDIRKFFYNVHDLGLNKKKYTQLKKYDKPIQK